MAFTVLKILMCLAEKLQGEEDDYEPRRCRVCLEEDEDGEEWIDPCHCPQSTAWTHRSCLEWRLKHTPSEEDKVRCEVCRFRYVKIIRLKSPVEWFNTWAGPQLLIPLCDLGLAYSSLLYVVCLSGVHRWWKVDPAGTIYDVFVAHIILGLTTWSVMAIRDAGLPSFYKSFFSVLKVRVGNARS